MRDFTKLIALGGLLAAGCSSETSVETSVQEIRTGRGGFVGADILVTDGSGEVVPCGEGTVTVRVQASRNGNPYFDVGNSLVHVACSDASTAEVAMVVDNSGSESGHLADLQSATRSFSDRVLAGGGKASLVRVSTNASVEVPLGNDGAAISAAIDDLHVANGWTSLYDGIRQANETIGGAVQAAASASEFANSAAFCSAAQKRGIVVFTDGRENNSSDEHADTINSAKYPGDGYNTLLSDVLNLRIDGVTTPIYTVGLGEEVDSEALTAIAEQSGGRYIHIDDASQLPTVYDHFADYFGSTYQVCVDLPQDQCGSVDLKIDYTWTQGNRTVTANKEEHLSIPCADVPSGKIATAVLTFSNPGISQAQASALAQNAVDWVSSDSQFPRVMIVRDDDHHNEAKDDPIYIKNLLLAQGYEVGFLEEPSSGITIDQLAGYNVVWFSNPGYPMDDKRSFDTLVRFASEGGGVVLQGDDITWSMGNNFSMSPLTHLRHIGNGTSTCGKTTDNNSGHRLSIATTGHELTAGVGNFNYGDDIDHSAPMADLQVIAATGTLAGCNDFSTPVIVGFEPLPAAP